MDVECGFRKWDELIPDILGQIFGNLPLEEILTVAPRVCKSWGRAVMGPYCWQEINIEEWSELHEPHERDQMVRFLVDRSCGSLRKLCVYGISNDQTFSFIANHGKSLQTLCVPRSGISNTIVVEIAEMFLNLTFIDVSYCMEIGARALEAFGKHCKFLSGLRRVMHPIEVIDKESQDDEALAIAYSMPNLKHLEIAYLVIDTTSVIEILKNCTELELLDVRGCWHVDLDDDFLMKYPKLKVLGPHFVDDSCYLNGWESCSDISNYSGYLAWGFTVGDDEFEEMSDGYWEEERRIEDVQMWFYGDDGELMDAAIWDWNQAP